MRRFSRALFGANPEEVRGFLAEVAAAIDRLNSELAHSALERTGLQSSLQQATAQIEELRRQLAAAHDKIAAYQAEESLMAKVLMNAQKMTEEVIERTKTESERTVTEANAAAEATLHAARQEAADLLREARTRAEEAVKAAERAAAAQLAEVRLDSERVVEQAGKAVAELRQTAEQQVRSVMANIEAALLDNASFAEHVDVLAKRHAASLDTLAHLQAEVKDDILPALREMLQALKGGEAIPSRPAPPAPPESAGPPPTGSPPPPSAPFPATPPSREETARPKVTPRTGGERPAGQRPRGEILVSPVHSYLQASQLVTAVSRMKGVRAARLRAYSGGVVTIDVLTETGDLTNIDTALLDGVPVDVVEATDNRIVLRLSKAPNPTAS